MRRRRFLGSVGTGLLLGAAGCVGSDSGSGDGTSGGSGDGSSDGGDGGNRTTDASSTSTPTDTSTPVETATDPAPTANVTGRSSQAASLRDVDLPLSDSDLDRGAPKDAIPAITGPVFGEDWSQVEETLDDDDRVIGVEVDGHARAYPLAILNWHEIVNDNFGGPLLVTYCPLCGSGVTAERRVNGKETIFGVSGYLWHSDLVMYDKLTNSLWSQILAKAVKGPKTGEPLTLRPSTLTTWRQWHDAHPETKVLIPPPVSNTITGEVDRDYETNPYSNYAYSERIGIGYNSFEDDRLHPKTQVIGIATDGAAKAYPFGRVEGAGGVVNDTVGNLPVVVATVDESLVAYVRTVEGKTLEFSRTDGALSAGGSTWSPVTGTAKDGPYEGSTLKRANDRTPMFWFAWLDFYPDTAVYGTSG